MKKFDLPSVSPVIRRIYAIHSEWFLREWKYLLLSLLIAVAAYFLVQGEVMHETTLEIPVRMADYTEGLLKKRAPKEIEATPVARTVKVVFRGDSGEIAALGTGANLSVEIPYPSKKRLDAALGSDGKVMVEMEIKRDFVRGNRLRDARPVEFNPPSVSIVIDESVEFRFDVEPTLAGTPATNHVAKIVGGYKKEAVVRGPKSRLIGLRNTGWVLRTEPIDLEGRAQSFPASVRILPPADVPDAVITPEKIDVQVAVVEVMNDQSMVGELTNVPVRVTQETGGLGATWVAEPESVILRVRGAAASIEEIRSEQARLFAVVHAENDEADGKQHRVLVFMPDDYRKDLELVTPIPPFVTLWRTAQENEEKRVEPADAASGESGAPAAPAVEPSGDQPAETSKSSETRDAPSE